MTYRWVAGMAIHIRTHLIWGAGSHQDYHVQETRGVESDPLSLILPLDAILQCLRDVWTSSWIEKALSEMNQILTNESTSE